MDPRDRKAVIATYKERAPAFGIYAIICNATGQVWVGRSRHVDTAQNGHWFALKFGTSPHKSLQSVWTQHGADEFRFEELDRLGEDYPPLMRWDELKKRLDIWKARLDACCLN